MGIKLNLPDPFTGAVPVHLSDLGDTFSRADGPLVGSSFESGAASWGTYLSGTGANGPQVVGGRVRAGSGQNDARGAVVPTGWPNRDIVVRVAAMGVGDLAVVVSADSSTVRATLSMSGGVYSIRQVGGTTPGARLTTTVAPAAGDVILIEVRGATVDLYVNGTHAGTAAIDAPTLQHTGVITYPSDLVTALDYFLIYRR